MKSLRPLNHLAVLTAFVCFLIPHTALSQASVGEPGRVAGKPNPLKNVYFGEQHLRTQDSPDAFAMGTLNSQDDAFKFCKGEAIKKSTGGGYTVQKKTPYDWCAVTDHAVMMGLLPMTLDKSSPLYKTKVAGLIRSGTLKDMDAAFGQNLHRNVFFRDDAGPEMPFSTLDSDRTEDLWTYLDVQRDAGHEVFAIPQNSNLSNSLMFPTVNSYGQRIDKAWIDRRAKNEVAVEIIQT
jgi:hypothetical protein